MLNKEFYTTKEIIELFGINRQTLHRWRQQGIIQYRNIGKRKFIYKKQDIDKLLGNPLSQQIIHKKNVIYCRVSSQKQKQDLLKQKQILLDFCNSNGFIINHIYCEIASSINENRIEFNKMLNSILNHEVANIFITYKDRLSRFCFEYFENIFKKFGCKIITLNNKINEENFEQELTEDIINMIHHFSMELDSDKRKKLKEAKQILTS